MKLLYENLIERLIDTGLSRKEAEHLFVLAIEDVIMELDDKMLAQDENFIAKMSGRKIKGPLA